MAPPRSGSDNESVQVTRYDRTAILLTPAVRAAQPLITWIIAQPATERHYLLQVKSCRTPAFKGQGKWFVNGPVHKCKTCTERTIGGTCRFHEMRAFAAVLNDEEIDVFEVKDRKTGRYDVVKKISVQGATVEGMSGWPCIKGFGVGEWPDLKDWVLTGNIAPDTMTVFEPSTNQYPHGISIGARAIEDAFAADHDDAWISQLDEEAQAVLRFTAVTLHEKLRQVAKYFPGPKTKDGWSHLPGALSTPIIWRQREPDERVVCDACAAACFLCSWTCMLCGNELCIDCWEEWQPGTANTDGNGTERLLRPRLDHCGQRKRHTRAHFYLVCRANVSEVKWLLAKTSSQIWSESPVEVNLEEVEKADRFFRQPYNLPSVTVGGNFTQEDQEILFGQVWHALGDADLGVPIVMHGILSPRHASLWTPEYFEECYGTELCQVVDCDSNVTSTTTIAKFFEAFLLEENSVKLKDWPPQTDFAQHCPELFGDFEENLLPFRNRMGRTGILNLASMFPQQGVCVPDLGPKCYIASAAPGFLASAGYKRGEYNEGVTANGWATNKGTTNLHLDVTDAINIMVYAAPILSQDDESPPPPPAALWHVFSPASTPMINSYLRQKFASDRIDDPINRQVCYLNAHDMAILNTEEWGFTRAFLICQEPGDAVLIPAGCAHQVANGRSCIKVAVDFVSPERIHLCASILGMFRDLAGRYVYRDADDGKAVAQAVAGKLGAGAWPTGPKEDVLQPFECLFFTWFQIATLAKKLGLKGTCAGLQIASSDDSKEGSDAMVIDEEAEGSEVIDHAENAGDNDTEKSNEENEDDVDMEVDEEGMEYGQEIENGSDMEDEED
ncbi:MAG: hypothetical protein M1816_005547 [Peltula sp. TS41687]|nr:MAG: hypothetical protein M1816_005547 [Peltula sp. TS41687]